MDRSLYSQGPAHNFCVSPALRSDRDRTRRKGSTAPKDQMKKKPPRPKAQKSATAKPLTAAQLQSMGGKARMKMLTKQERIDQARKAIETRWKKHRENQAKNNGQEQ